MTTATITKVTTETVVLNLDSECWPSGMTDQDKLIGWLFAARIEPDEAFKYLDVTKTIEIDGEVNK